MTTPPEIASDPAPPRAPEPVLTAFFWAGLVRVALLHAGPTCARHGVLKGQIDISARVIWRFEKLGWANKVRWPNQERLAAKRVGL